VDDEFQSVSPSKNSGEHRKQPSDPALIIQDLQERIRSTRAAMDDQQAAFKYFFQSHHINLL